MPESLPFASRLSSSDRLMWKIERDPVLRSPVLALGVLDRDPDGAGVHRMFERAAARVPRLRQRIEGGGFPGGALQWVDDPAFSLDYHLRRIRLPHPADIRSLLDVAAPWATSMLDPARPLWECTIVEGLEGGRGAFVFKFHHTVSDGVGGVDLAEAIFDTTRHGAAPVAREAGASPAAPSALARGRDALGAALEAIRRPGHALRDATRFGRSVAHMLAPAPSPLSPTLHHRGLGRHLDVLEVPLDDLRAAARTFGGTINDAFLSAVAGGFHDFHQRVGVEVPALRITMPINLREGGDLAGGNRFAPARFVLPIDDPDPVTRARIAGAISRRWRREPAIAGTELLAGLLDRLPGGLVTRLFGSMLKNIDVDAVDLPGLQRPAYIGGAHIERLWAFAPPTGAAVSVTLLSDARTACIGIVTDVAAVSEPEPLRTCLEGAFEQVCQLAEGSAPTVERIGA